MVPDQGRRPSKNLAPKVPEQGRVPSKRTSSKASCGQGVDIDRRFSFADLTLRQVQDSVAPETVPFFLPFWEAVLYGATGESFRYLRSRTLAYWVNCFNTWQRLKKAGGIAPNFVDSEQLRQILGLPQTMLADMVKLFNPLSAKQQEREGLKKLTVNLIDIFFAGVLLSPVITTTHKLRFCFGLCDADDSGALNLEEFIEFVRAAFCGIASVFETRRPPKDLVASIAERCFKRLSRIAASRVIDIVGKGNVLRDDVIRTIKVLQAQAAQAAEKSRIGNNFVTTQNGELTPMQKMESVKAPRTGVTQQLIDYHVLESFLVGSVSEQDTLALPLRMFTLRFCRKCDEDLADSLAAKKNPNGAFTLSHKQLPVKLPDEPKVAKVDLLIRPEVLVVREVFREFTPVESSWYDHEREVNTIMQGAATFNNTRPIVRDRIVLFYRTLATKGQVLSRVDGFEKLCQAACPKALPKHLIMFGEWCRQYDALMQNAESVSDLERIRDIYRENDGKPTISDKDLQQLEKDFEQLDIDKNGTADKRWVYDRLPAHMAETAAEYAADGWGTIDFEEFLCVMCPLGFKTPLMSGVDRQVFGKLFDYEYARRSKTLSKTCHFLGPKAICQQGHALTYDRTQRDGFVCAKCGSSMKLGSEVYRCLECKFYHCKDCSTKLYGWRDPEGNDALRDQSMVALDMTSILPEVDRETWDQWHSIFSTFDLDGDGKVDLVEMKRSGKLAPETAEYVMHLIDPDETKHFTLDGFMEAMLKAHGFQPRRSIVLSP
jgi:Ca2+-binding EF-hand superfamily protein